MSDNPPLWGRMFARLQGEVPTTTLEAYRRASQPVFELMERVEARRQACAIEGLTPWTIPPATRAEFLCAWNAFVLQTLGNDILDADYDEYPPTAGYVPPVTAHQVLAFFAQVEGWLDRAQQASASPDYVLDVDVPARLPAWKEAEPCPPSHLRGLLQAMRAVGEHAAAALAILPEAVADPEHQKQLNRIRQLHASAQSKARYAAELHGHDPTPEVQDRAEPYARQAVEMFYELGQLVADPTLIGPRAPAVAGAPSSPALAPSAEPVSAAEAEPAKRPPAKPPRPLPGQSGFDEWCLTAPAARPWRKPEETSRNAIRKMWKADPDPARTLAIHAVIQQAVKEGAVAYAVDEFGRRYAARCPWGPVYVAVRGVTVQKVMLDAGQAFFFDVRNGKNDFIRRIQPMKLKPRGSGNRG
jgi:hypothetical protein